MCSHTDPTFQTTQERIRGRSAALVLLLIVLLAIVLRTYRLAEQSVWIDEFFNIAYGNAPDLPTYVTLLRFFSLEAMPIAFSSQYLWGCLVGTGSIVVLRMLPVLLSLCGITLLYATGAYVYGRRAGLFAAFLCAVSPVHVWVGQSIRPDVFVEVFALLAAYGLLRATREGKARWWSLNVVANILLVWTHVFTSFLVVTEGLYLLLWLRRRPLGVSVWAVTHMTLVASAYLWLRTTLNHVATSEDDFIFAPPRLGQILIDWFADDAVLLSNPFWFQPLLPQTLRELFEKVHPVFDSLVFVLFASVFAWCAFTGLRALRRQGRDAASPVLLLLISTGPLVILTALSLLWRPCLLPHYTNYSSFALYIMAGGVLGALAESAKRRWFLGAVMAVYVFQLSLVLAGSTRTDWLGAQRHIENHMEQGDVVLVKGTYLAWENFRFNDPAFPLPVLPAYSFESLCEKSARLLTAGPGSTPAVWVLMEPFVYTLPPSERFEQCLSANGMAWSRTDFSGMNGLFLYRVSPDSGAGVVTAPPCAAIETDVDYVAILEDMGLGGLHEVEREEAVCALRCCVDTEWPLTRFYYSVLALQLCDEGYLDLAEAAARRAIALDATYPYGHFALTAVLCEKGDMVAARAAYDATNRSDPIGNFAFYAPMFEALFEGDAALARKHFQRLDNMGAHLPQSLRNFSKIAVWKTVPSNS